MLSNQALFCFLLGGPKLRRWYGAADQLPRDGTGGERLLESSRSSVMDGMIWHGMTWPYEV